MDSDNVSVLVTGPTTIKSGKRFSITSVTLQKGMLRYITYVIFQNNFSYPRRFHVISKPKSVPLGNVVYLVCCNIRHRMEKKKKDEV